MIPNTLDDLLALLPGLRRLRSLNAALLRVLLDRQRRQCTWCGNQVGTGRSTWCSDECVRAFKFRCSPNDAARFVEKRDRGICGQCGRDTVAAEQEAKRLRLQSGLSIQYRESREVFEVRRQQVLEQLRQYGYARGQFREVDHAVPVVEYGGLCDVSALRLLCGVCHADATATLAAALAARKGKVAT